MGVDVLSKQTIWNYFKTHTNLPDQAIAGIMGNFEAESNCEACRKQGDFSADRSASKEYARLTNAGLSNFVHDSIGFGLAQWTYFSRKQNLLSYCQGKGVGVEDETAQLEFFLGEMQNEYMTTWKALLGTYDIYTAAALVCRNYERPAVDNSQIRAQYGRQIYEQFHGTTPEPTPTPEPEPMGRDAIIDAIYELLEKLR